MKSKTREELIKIYTNSLKEGEIPWRKRWISTLNINGCTKKEYKGINQLLLNYMSYKNNYSDNRWFTYLQIKENNWKLKDAKGKGVPIEFWSVYDIKNKKRINYDEFNKIISEHPEAEENYKLFCNTSFVYNADLINGVPEINYKKSEISHSKEIQNMIKKIDVEYEEHGNRAYYSPYEDKIVLPEKEKFIDEYSYYATQLHELCHSTGHEKRLHRNLFSEDKKDYAREELIAEISSSFLMQKFNIDVKAEHIDNHKSYIQSWIKLLEDKPQELFSAISESNKVFEYISDKSKLRDRER